MLDGVYRRTEGEPDFQEARAPSRDELAVLLEKIIARLLKMLIRLGHLVEEEGVRYIADMDADNSLASLQAASCTYRIAASAARRGALWRLSAQGTRTAVPLHHAPRDRQRTGEARWIGGCRAATQKRVARRHHAHQDVAAGIYAAPGRRYSRGQSKEAFKFPIR